MRYSSRKRILCIGLGVFLVSLIEWRLHRVSFWQVLGIVFSLFLGWKLFEFFTDLYWHYHYISTHLGLWVFDLIGDYAATIIGGLFYWRVFIYKKFSEDRLD